MLIYADDVNLLRDNDTSKEAGLEVNAENLSTAERRLSELPINRTTATKECFWYTNTIAGLFQMKCLKMLIYNCVY
jgi:hypothetical protein